MPLNYRRQLTRFNPLSSDFVVVALFLLYLPRNAAKECGVRVRVCVQWKIGYPQTGLNWMAHDDVNGVSHDNGTVIIN